MTCDVESYIDMRSYCIAVDETQTALRSTRLERIYCQCDDKDRTLHAKANVSTMITLQGLKK